MIDCAACGGKPKQGEIGELNNMTKMLVSGRSPVEMILPGIRQQLPMLWNGWRSFEKESSTAQQSRISMPLFMTSTEATFEPVNRVGRDGIPYRFQAAASLSDHGMGHQASPVVTELPPRLHQASMTVKQSLMIASASVHHRVCGCAHSQQKGPLLAPWRFLESPS